MGEADRDKEWKQFQTTLIREIVNKSGQQLSQYSSGGIPVMLVVDVQDDGMLDTDDVSMLVAEIKKYNDFSIKSRALANLWALGVIVVPDLDSARIEYLELWSNLSIPGSLRSCPLFVKKEPFFKQDWQDLRSAVSS